MSKLNSTRMTKDLNPGQRTVGVVAGHTTDTAAMQTNIQALRRVVLANLLWEDIAYIDGETVSGEISRLIPLCDPKDVALLVIEAREVQKLRHTPLYIVSEMCKYEQTKPYVADLLKRIITRADMLTDFIAIYWRNGKCPLANVAKKGLAMAFHNFNEYKFAKYDRDAPIKLRDVMFMVHPKPESVYETELFKKIADRTLQTPDTWEVALTDAHTDEEKRQVWERLIDENKLGSMATLMNLRNMQSANVSRSVINKALENLNGQMLLPLQFLKARENSEGLDKELEDAMIKSYANLPKLPGKTLFVVDVSGSMTAYISDKSRFTRLDAAAAMAMLAINQCEDFELVCTAGSDARRVEAHEFIKYPSKGFKMLQDIKDSKLHVGGGGIFTAQLFKGLRKELGDKINEYDRVIVFSDSQDVDVSYGSTVKPQPFGKKNYICDVSAHTHGIAYKGVWTAEITGWSEHFLTYIAAFEGLTNTFED